MKNLYLKNIFDFYIYLQGRIKALFQIGNCFWAHKNWCPNFDRSTKDVILILFKSLNNENQI